MMIEPLSQGRTKGTKPKPTARRTKGTNAKPVKSIQTKQNLEISKFFVNEELAYGRQQAAEAPLKTAKENQTQPC